MSTPYQHELLPPKPLSIATLVQVSKVIHHRTTLPTIAKHPQTCRQTNLKQCLVQVICTSDKGHIQPPLFQPLTPSRMTNLFTKHNSTQLPHSSTPTPHSSNGLMAPNSPTQQPLMMYCNSTLHNCPCLTADSLPPC